MYSDTIPFVDYYQFPEFVATLCVLLSKKSLENMLENIHSKLNIVGDDVSDFIFA